jgi:hypothetical protein
MERSRVSLGEVSATLPVLHKSEGKIRGMGNIKK